MTNHTSNAPSTPATTIIESLDELAGAITAPSTCPDMTSSPPTRSTSPSSSERQNANLGPGDMYEATLNDEIVDSSEQVEGNKRRRERHRRTALSVECHPFFNAQYMAYLEDQVHKKQTETQQGEGNNQENVPQMCPPDLIAEKIFDNAHTWNWRRRVQRAKRRTCCRSNTATNV